MAASDQSAEIHVGYIANLVNIEYPGCIKNPEKALQTLGGLKKLKEMIQSPDTRLPLKFRPDDIYCKPAYATIFSTNNVVLNVKQKRNKKTGAVKMFVTLTGIIEKTYKFTTMMDYQYLTMEKNGDECKPLGGLVTITDLELTSWLTNGAPLHFMPQIFSPLDVPYAYHFKEEDNKKSAELQQGSLFATARKKRFSYNQLVTYDDENVPTEPSAGAESKIVTQYLKEKLAEVKKLFDERPIWTRAAITCVTRLNSNRLKTILPCVGYNSISGPWRTMWIRHGYDPRKNVGAKHYQLIDYRYRQRDKADMEKNIVLHKRSYSKYFSSITRAKPKQSKSDQLELINKPGADYDGDKMTEEQRLQQYKLWPGMVPPYRQIFYQIIDIELPEVQAIVNSNEGREGPCSKTNGFLVENAHNRIRAVINKNVTAAMEELMGEGEGTSAEVTEAEEDYEDDDEAYPEAEQSMADGDAYTGEGDGCMVDDSYNEQEILNSYR